MSLQILLEGLLKLRDKEGKLIAVVDNNPKIRSQVFYNCSEMGVEEIKELLEKINEKETTIEK